MRASAGWLVAVLLLAACSDGDVDRTEVAGVVLESEEVAEDPVEPLELGAQTSRLGSFLGFGDDGVELGGHGPVDTDRPVTLVADIIEQADGRVSCRAALQAPDDRPLDAEGQLRVDLVRELRGGEVERTARQLIDLEVELEAGQRHDLPHSEPVEIDPDELSGVWCEARHSPA